MPGLSGAHHMPDVFQKIDDILKDHFRNLSAEKDNELAILQSKFLSFSEKNSSLEKSIAKSQEDYEKKLEELAGLETSIGAKKVFCDVEAQRLSGLQKSVEEHEQKKSEMEIQYQELLGHVGESKRKLDKQTADTARSLEEQTNLKKNIQKLEERQEALTKTVAEAEAEEQKQKDEFTKAKQEYDEILLDVKTEITEANIELAEAQGKIDIAVDVLNSTLTDERDISMELAKKRAEFEEEVKGEREELAKGIQSNKELTESLQARSNAIVQQEKTNAGKTMELKRGKDLLVKIATELSLGQEMSLGSIINQLKSI